MLLALVQFQCENFTDSREPGIHSYPSLQCIDCHLEKKRKGKRDKDSETLKVLQYCVDGESNSFAKFPLRSFSRDVLSWERKSGRRRKWHGRGCVWSVRIQYMRLKMVGEKRAILWRKIRWYIYILHSLTLYHEIIRHLFSKQLCGQWTMDVLKNRRKNTKYCTFTKRLIGIIHRTFKDSSQRVNDLRFLS